MAVSISSIGYWWLPDKPEKTVTGRLDYSIQRGGELKLFGFFTEKEKPKELPNILQDFQSFNIINGWMEGKEITLYKCSQIGATMNEMTLKVKYILLGTNFKDVNEIKYYKFKMGLTHLDYWVKTKSMIFNPKDNALKIGVIKPKILFENENVKIQINEFTNMNFSNYGSRNYKFQEKIELCIDIKDEEWPILDVLNFTYKLQNFFVIALGIPVYPLYVKGYNKDKYIEFPEGNINHIPIDILYNIGLYNPVQKYNYEKIILKYDEHKDIMQSILEAWFTKEEMLRPIYNLFLSLFYNPNMYQQNSFINLSQAIEIYHRRTRDNNFLDPETYKKNRDEVIESVPEVHKNWVKSRLTNEPSANERLFRILTEFDFLDESLLGDLDEFRRQIRDTRNYLVHYNEDLKYKVTDTYDIHNMIGKLILILYSCVLHELNISNEDIEKIIKNNDSLLSYLKSEPLFT